ncbi:MAG: spermidine/putrescine ABC transporter ATP-binding subunit [Granulosicoccus sp.]|jgi:spermidine/putrescine ABC transporter ATP-binding subunit
MSDSIVSIRNVSKRFDSILALNDVSIEIRSGEIFALLGPSGCGKSTLLRVISGFESPSSGELLLDGKDMTQLAPNKRPINMVFQSYAVFPHMSVEKNVAYGLKMEKLPAAEIESRVVAALEQVHLQDYATRMPDQLSGGQRQRVALARALVKKPRVLLLDEPLSALDAKLRDAMRLELVKLQETVGITFIIVTHDQAEAMAMADRIAVLESGKLRQVATPEELYSNPVDAFVADFIGNINAFDVIGWKHNNGQLWAHTDLLGQVILGTVDPPAFLGAAGSKSDAVLAVRPEHVSVSLSKPDKSRVALVGTLGDIAFQGQHCIAEIRLKNDTSISAIIDNDLAKSLPSAIEQAPIWAFWEATNMLLLPRKAE